MRKMNLVERLKELKDEPVTQVKASKLYELSYEFEEFEVVGEIFNGLITSRAYVEDDVFSESREGNLQSIKNKLEGVSDFSVSWYKDMNGNYEDLSNETLDMVIDDCLRELMGD